MAYKRRSEDLHFGITGHVETKCMGKTFVSLEEGVILYSIGLTTFRKLAEEAGATYKVNGKRVLVNTTIFEKYLEGFRITSR